MCGSFNYPPKDHDFVAAMLEDLGIMDDPLEEEENEILAGMEDEPTHTVDLGEDQDSQEPAQ